MRMCAFVRIVCQHNVSCILQIDTSVGSTQGNMVFVWWGRIQAHCRAGPMNLTLPIEDAFSGSCRCIPSDSVPCGNQTLSQRGQPRRTSKSASRRNIRNNFLCFPQLLPCRSSSMIRSVSLLDEVERIGCPKGNGISGCSEVLRPRQSCFCLFDGGCPSFSSKYFADKSREVGWYINMFNIFYITTYLYQVMAETCQLSRG